MKRKILPAFILFLLTGTLASGQAKNPEQPFTPEIVNEADNPAYKKNANVTIQGKGVIGVEIFFSSDTLATGDSLVPAIQISQVNRITAVSWQKYKRNRSYVFYPSRYEVVYRDSRKVMIDGNIRSLNLLKVKVNNRFRNFFMFYYDSYKKNKWENSGLADFNIFFTKPADGCVTSIEVMR